MHGHRQTGGVQNSAGVHHSAGDPGGGQAENGNPGERASHGKSHQPEYKGPLPHGEDVTLYTEVDHNYRLTSRADRVFLSFKNQLDPQQYWIKVDMGDKHVDKEGSRAFLLVNKSTGRVLSHGSGDVVSQEEYRPNMSDSSVLWSQGRDEGKGFTAIRAFHNIDLNLDADHGDRYHGGIKEGNKLILFAWNKKDNQKWMIAPVSEKD